MVRKKVVEEILSSCRKGIRNRLVIINVDCYNCAITSKTIGERINMDSHWVKCPRCGNKHFIKVSPETRIYKFPAYCKRCKNEIVITVEPRAKAVNS